jgi:hypothetical protein
LEIITAQIQNISVRLLRRQQHKRGWVDIKYSYIGLIDPASTEVVKLNNSNLIGNRGYR